MQNKDLIRALVHGAPGVPFELSPGDPEAEATTLAGEVLIWPADAAVAKPTIVQARAWHDEITAAETTCAASEATLRARADGALAALQAAYDGWAALTAVQKDATAKLQLRVVIALVRLVLRKLDAT